MRTLFANITDGTVVIEIADSILVSFLLFFFLFLLFSSGQVLLENQSVQTVP